MFFTHFHTSIIESAKALFTLPVPLSQTNSIVMPVWSSEKKNCTILPGFPWVLQGVLGLTHGKANDKFIANKAVC